MSREGGLIIQELVARDLICPVMYFRESSQSRETSGSVMNGAEACTSTSMEGQVGQETIILDVNVEPSQWKRLLCSIV